MIPLSRSTVPIAAAINLAVASFNNEAHGGVSAATTDTAPPPIAHTGNYVRSIQISAEELFAAARLASFVRSFFHGLPPLELYRNFFSDMDEEGALVAAGLSPVERETLLACIDYGAENVLQALLKGQSLPTQKRTLETLFGSLRQSPSTAAEDAAHNKVASSPNPEYIHALQLVFVIAADKALLASDPTRHPFDPPPKNFPPGRASLLMAVIGAAQLSEQLPVTSISYFTSMSYLGTQRDKITQQEKQAIPLLAHIDRIGDNPIARSVFVLSLGGLAYWLWSRFQRPHSKK